MRWIAISFSAVGILLAALFVGAERIVFWDLFDQDSPSYRILLSLRLPRLLTTLATGAALSCLGGVYQVLFHNPLSDPYILGIATAATLGSVVATVIFHVPAEHLFSWIGSIICSIVVVTPFVFLSLQGTARQSERILLTGMGLNFLLSSLLFLVIFYREQQLGGGSLRYFFGHIPWNSLPQSIVYVLVTTMFLILIWIFGRHLDALGLGDTVARTLGFAPERARAIFLVLSSALLVLVVLHTGIIGFVGLVVPHVSRLLFRPASSRMFLCIAAPLGGLFLISSDILSRALYPPLEFPVGIITTLFGGPIFLWILWKHMV